MQTPRRQGRRRRRRVRVQYEQFMGMGKLQSVGTLELTLPELAHRP